MNKNKLISAGNTGYGSKTVYLSPSAMLLALSFMIHAGNANAQPPRESTVEVGKRTTISLRRAVNPSTVSVTSEPNNIARGWLDTNQNRFVIEGLAEGTTRMTFAGTYRAIYVGRELVERAVPFSEVVTVRVLPGTRPTDSRTIPISVSVGANRVYARHVLMGVDFRNSNEQGVRWRNFRVEQGDQDIAEAADNSDQMRVTITGRKNGRTRIILHGERMNNRVWQKVERVLDVRVGTGSPATPRDSGRAVEEISWDTVAFVLPTKVGERYRFRCPPNPDRRFGRIVYGTDAYSTHSGVCLAAVHAGKIRFEAGGLITIEFRPERDYFPGNERNGVRSHNLSVRTKSFVFL